MYKKALLTLLLGLAIFYAAAAIKYMLLSPNTIHCVVDPIPSPPPLIVTPPLPPMSTIQPPHIDVVFAIDSTSSMSDEINVVKENIRSIIAEISQGEPRPLVRYGIVSYRDRGDDYVTKYWQLTDDIQKIQAALASIRAEQGNDKPESVNEALHVALNKMNWDQQAASKMIFLIGDAGPHNYPNDYRWEKEIEYAQSQNIAINTIACSGMENDEEEVFSAIARGSNGQLTHLTYKQEYTRADGSHTVVIEEAGRTYEVSDTAADKDWSYGVDTLIARGDAKPLASSSPSKEYESYDEETAIAADATTSAYSPADALAGGSPTNSKARPSTEANNAPLARATTNKTNNLNTVLAESIKTAARRQDVSYGTALKPSFDFQGINSTVRTPRQLIVESRAQLQSLLTSEMEANINQIDFNNNFVVAVFLGRVAANSSVSINDIQLIDNQLVMGIKQNIFSGVASVTPFHVIVLPRTWAGRKLEAKNLAIKMELR